MSDSCMTSKQKDINIKELYFIQQIQINDKHIINGKLISSEVCVQYEGHRVIRANDRQ